MCICVASDSSPSIEDIVFAKIARSQQMSTVFVSMKCDQALNAECELSSSIADYTGDMAMVKERYLQRGTD